MNRKLKTEKKVKRGKTLELVIPKDDNIVDEQTKGKELKSNIIHLALLWLYSLFSGVWMWMSGGLSAFSLIWTIVVAIICIMSAVFAAIEVHNFRRFKRNARSGNK